MTTVLTVPPLLFGLTGLAGPVMRSICRGWATKDGRTCVPVPTKASLASDAITGGAELLDSHIRSASGDVVVLAHSQGAQVVSEWLRRYADAPTRPDPERLRFVLLGNPDRGKRNGAKGGGTWAGKLIPDTRSDTGYRVDDIARRGDKYACPTGAWNGASIHMNYRDVDLDKLATTALTKTMGGSTTYWTVP